jgi:hypothetical protein
MIYEGMFSQACILIFPVTVCSIWKVYLVLNDIFAISPPGMEMAKMPENVFHDIRNELSHKNSRVDFSPLHQNL